MVIYKYKYVLAAALLCANATIGAMAQAVNDTNNKAQDPATRINIDPLIKTCWRQYSPYNRQCPVINGSATAVGCVALSMGQIMKMYESPLAGKGSVSYTQAGKTIKADFSKPFDWDNMLDEYAYNTPYTDAEANAVADLLFRVGVSLRMQYGGQSAATDAKISSSLQQYFGYDHNMAFLERGAYTDEEWEQIMYDELAAGRPIAYGGVSNYNAHSFVIDGYRDGKFHVNWGWTGYTDGFYTITSLPYFPYAQTATIGIQPETGEPIRHRLTLYDDWNLNLANLTTRGKISVTMSVQNNTLNQMKGLIGVMVEDRTLRDTTYTTVSRTLKYGQSIIESLSISVNGYAPEHSYRLTPVFQPEGEDTWQTMHCAPCCSGFTFGAEWVDDEDDDENEETIVRGDINGDGSVTIEDITELINLYLNQQ